MGCGCGKKAANFKQAIQQAKVNVTSSPVPISNPTPNPTPAPVSQKTRRQLRIEARARRIARRDARVKARIQQQNVINPQ